MFRLKNAMLRRNAIKHFLPKQKMQFVGNKPFCGDKLERKGQDTYQLEGS